MGHEKPAWLTSLYAQKFFASCSIHEHAKKNEKNILCLDCCTSICPHCVLAHRSHRLLQIRRYVYNEVVRLEDLENLMDCSNIQAYTINAAKVLFLKKRPQNRQFKGTGNYCTSCDRGLQDPFSHCSLGCKVDFILEHYKDIWPFMRVCKTLKLGPDFIFPQEMGDDYDTTNETLHSTIVDDSGDGPMNSMSGSSGSENMSFSCNGVVRKKRSGMYVCGRLDSKTTEEDMASSMSRRKGIPHRSPMC